MLEYTGAGGGARLIMLVLHDDAQREYAYGPAQGLPDTKVGTFTQALYNEAKKDGWTVISMENGWKRVLAFDWRRRRRRHCRKRRHLGMMRDSEAWEPAPLAGIQGISRSIGSTREDPYETACPSICAYGAHCNTDGNVRVSALADSRG